MKTLDSTVSLHESSLDSDLGDPGLIAGQLMWDLWWKKWYSNKFFSVFLPYPYFSNTAPSTHFFRLPKTLTSPCGICGGKSDIRIFLGFSPLSMFF